MGKMELGGLTKAKLHDKKIAHFSTTRAEGHQKMLLKVA